MTTPTLTLEVEDNGLEEPHPTYEQMLSWLEQFIYTQCDANDIGLSIAFVTPENMQAFNLHYRQKDKSTNVLSFPAQLPEDLPQKFLGDIVFCHAVIAKEATSQGKPLEAHYAHLLIHGTLHLLGYDHNEPLAAQEMEQLEVNILETLGFPDPYKEDV